MIKPLPKRTRAVRISAINPDSGKEHHFNSIRDAAKQVGCSTTSIHRALDEVDYTCCGYRWRRDDLPLAEMLDLVTIEVEE